jgi:hypothetical protein
MLKAKEIVRRGKLRRTRLGSKFRRQALKRAVLEVLSRGDGPEAPPVVVVDKTKKMQFLFVD